jgi:uncharacterized protein (TIGR03435 family)
MRSEKKHSDETLDKALGLFSEPSFERMETARSHVSEQFDSVHEHEGKQVPVNLVPASRKVRWPAVAGIAAAILVAILIPATALRSAPAVLEDGAGSRKVQYGEVVRGGVLKFSDGSRVDVRPESELSLEPTNRGVRVRLQKGRVVVRATKELVIETKEMSATGTAFAVNAKEEGWSVEARESEAHVQQGTTATTLSPGGWVSSPARTPQVAPREVAPREAFEEASVKVSLGGVRGASGPLPYPCNGAGPTINPGRFAVSYISLYRLITWAYGKNCGVVERNNLLTGGPDWVRTDPYAIEALIPSGTPASTVQDLLRGTAPKVQKMLQTLLAERFKLVVRAESKEVPAYNLVSGKNTGRLKLAEDQTPIDPASRQQGNRRGTFSSRLDQTTGIMTISADAVPLQDFFDAWLPMSDRPVVNKIDMKGLYDIPQFQFAIDTPSPAGTQLRQVLEQLGFKLESAKAPMEVLVIDHVEKPTEN